MASWTSKPGSQYAVRVVLRVLLVLFGHDLGVRDDAGVFAREVDAAEVAEAVLRGDGLEGVRAFEKAPRVVLTAKTDRPDCRSRCRSTR